MRVCVCLALLQSRSVSYLKCLDHHEEENQMIVTRKFQEIVEVFEILKSIKKEGDVTQKLQGPKPSSRLQDSRSCDTVKVLVLSISKS